MEYIKYYEEFKFNQSDLPPDLELQIKNSLKKNGKINAKNAVLKDEDNNTVAYYTYHKEGYDGGPDDPRTLKTWEDGLKYLKEIEGKNIDEIIRQCDQEVAKGEWYLPTWEETSTHDKSIPRIPAEKLYDMNIKK